MYIRNDTYNPNEIISNVNSNSRASIDNDIDNINIDINQIDTKIDWMGEVNAIFDNSTIYDKDNGGYRFSLTKNPEKQDSTA